MNLIALRNTYSIYKFRDESELPEPIYKSEFYSITRTEDELSVVTIQTDEIPDDIPCSHNWRVLKIEGPLDFSLTGIVAEISSILNKRSVPVFIVSTYNTDYILVKEDSLKEAIEALVEENHIIYIQ